jgi:hypothetical protein
VRRRAAPASLLAGLAVIALAQLTAPVGSPPLYDGVVVQEPYRYLVPAPGQVGSPTSFDTPLPVQGPTSPPFGVATTEVPPQAQLIAPPQAFVLPAGVTALTVSIEPVAASSPPSGGSIAGNVYRFGVTDEAGTALAIDQSTLPTLVLRAPDGIVAPTISRYAGGAWHDLPTQPSGQAGIFFTNVSELGDFALIAPSTSRPFGLDSTELIVIAVVAVLSAIVVGLLVLNRRRARALAANAPRQRRPASSKRRRGGQRRRGSR